MNNGLLGWPRGQLSRVVSWRRIPSPLQIPNCSLWLDASKITGLNDGDSLASWSDQSLGAAFSQSTSGNRPVYKTAQINGQAAVQFTATSSQYMTSNSVAPSSNFTVFAVIKASSTFSTPCTIWGASTLQGFQYRLSSKYQFVAQTSALIADSTSVPDNAIHVLSLSYAAGVYRFEKDGLSDGSGSSGQALVAATSLLGRNGYSSNEYYSGLIAELLQYDRPLVSNERVGVTAYLRTKYGL